ncbi:ABC transporter permease [Vibrio ziniensis]|uniref:ABC transporter permease n=1 Tax=Vibrio ziniensis TaxID=2711221 RepID=A0A6G7CMB4_9VIBR|nr:ABC transporter permease [Vibrio ziniensis]QIH43188.1 ABC transporter permease [Vibrio ziniensis]
MEHPVVSTSTASPAIESQWQLLRRDRWLLSCLTWIPIALAVTIWWIFSQAIVRDLPVGVVDLSNSRLSRQLTRELDATSTLSVIRSYTNVAQASEDLKATEIYAYVVIPRQFDKSIYRGDQPQITTFFNSQMILVGRLINSAVVQAQSTFNAQIEVVKTLAKGQQTTLGAMSHVLPIRTQITPLFNKNTNYAQFLVSAVVPAIWQIAMVVTTIMILTANHRTYGLAIWAKTNPLSRLVATLAPYSLVFVLQGAVFLTWFYHGLDWPLHGQISTILIAQWFTVIACMIMGSLFFFISLDPARAMSFAAAYTAPSFAFMGITFPTSDMGLLAQIWRSLLPVSHYIDVQVSQASYGFDAYHSLASLWPMLGYLVPFGLTLLLLKKHLQADLKKRCAHELV